MVEELVSTSQVLISPLTVLQTQGWQKQLKNRPILTGGYLRPSYANPPLPRMKPQPQHVSMMIRRRLGARSRRMQTHAMLKEFRDDLGRETGFEERLAKKHPEVKNVYRHLTWRKFAFCFTL